MSDLTISNLFIISSATNKEPFASVKESRAKISNSGVSILDNILVILLDNSGFNFLIIKFGSVFIVIFPPESTLFLFSLLFIFLFKLFFL